MIPGNYPLGISFVATDNGIESILPKNMLMADISSVDGLTIYTQDRDLVLSNGMVVNGQISFDKGQVYVAYGDSARINGVEVFAGGDRINIYDDGLMHTGNYVSFGQQDMIIQGEYVFAGFTEGNKYIEINDAENDKLAMVVRNGGMITVNNRADERKDLEVIITGGDYADSSVNIFNGKYDLSFGEYDFVGIDVVESFSTGIGSVPMEITFIDDAGNSLLGNDKDGEMKIVINNDNDFSYVGITSDAKSGKVNYYNNKLTRSKNLLESTFGKGTKFNIVFMDIDNWSYDEIEYVFRNLKELNEFSPKLIKTIDRINLVDDEHMIEKYGENSSVAGYILNDLNLVAVNRGELHDNRIIVHEAAHLYHNGLFEYLYHDLIRKWYRATDDGDVDKGYSMYKNIPGSKNAKTEINLEFTLEEGGWVSDYGSTNLNEDVATTVEYIFNYESVPYSIFNKYNKKVTLLCEYGFIPKTHSVCKRWGIWKIMQY